MTPDQPTALVEVTQGDRDAASDYLGYGNSDWGYSGDVRHGRIAHPLVEAFARHRIAALEEAARVAEEVRDSFLSPEYATGQPLSSFQERFACNQVATAIRKAKEGSRG